MPRYLLQQDAIFNREIDAPDQPTAARLGLQSDPIANTWEREWGSLEVTPINDSGEPLYEQTQSSEQLLPSPPPVSPQEAAAPAPPPPPPAEV